MTGSKTTKRLRDIPMNLGHWLEIDERCERKKWGLGGPVVEPYIRHEAGTAPRQVGEILSLLGIAEWTKKLDQERGVAKGEAHDFLDRMTKRRNRIAQ